MSIQNLIQRAKDLLADSERSQELDTEQAVALIRDLANHNPGRVPMPAITAAPATPPSSVLISGQGFTVTASAVKEGNVEVRFSTKPDETVRATLKAAGFRWSGANQCWYGRQDRLPQTFVVAPAPAPAAMTIGPGRPGNAFTMTDGTKVETTLHEINLGDDGAKDREGFRFEHATTGVRV